MTIPAIGLNGHKVIVSIEWELQAIDLLSGLMQIIDFFY
jgi:hypothetical protein